MSLVLFDLDGTLVDSGPGIRASVRHAAASVGIAEPTDTSKPADYAREIVAHLGLAAHVAGGVHGTTFDGATAVVDKPGEVPAGLDALRPDGRR